MLRACLILYDILTHKFNLWIYVGVMEYRSLFSATPTADRLSNLLFMVAVQYLVCRYILGPGESPTVSRSL